MSNNIIISADDFGISRLASENILKLVELGKINRVEVMMSKNISTSQVEELLASGVKLDIHLHLVKDQLDFWQEHARKIESGAVMRGIKFISKYLLGITSVKNIEKEWETQIGSFVEIFGKVPDGISSHEHIHFFPPYFNCVTKLCKKFNIRYVRFGKRDSADYSAIAKIINWLRSKNLKKITQSGLTTSDFMLSFDWVNAIDPILRQQYDNSFSTEIVFHPEKSEEFDILEKFDELN